MKSTIQVTPDSFENSNFNRFWWNCLYVLKCILRLQNLSSPTSSTFFLKMNYVTIYLEISSYVILKLPLPYTISPNKHTQMHNPQTIISNRVYTHHNPSALKTGLLFTLPAPKLPILLSFKPKINSISKIQIQIILRGISFKIV